MRAMPHSCFMESLIVGFDKSVSGPRGTKARLAASAPKVFIFGVSNKPAAGNVRRLRRIRAVRRGASFRINLYGCGRSPSCPASFVPSGTDAAGGDSSARCDGRTGRGPENARIASVLRKRPAQAFFSGPYSFSPSGRLSQRSRPTRPSELVNRQLRSSSGTTVLTRQFDTL